MRICTNGYLSKGYLSNGNRQFSKVLFLNRYSASLFLPGLTLEIQQKFASHWFSSFDSMPHALPHNVYRCSLSLSLSALSPHSPDGRLARPLLLGPSQTLPPLLVSVLGGEWHRKSLLPSRAACPIMLALANALCSSSLSLRSSCRQQWSDL
jgi:hypothetical protein